GRAELEGADVAGGARIAVAILRPRDAALVGGGAGLVARVDGRAPPRKRLRRHGKSLCGAAVKRPAVRGQRAQTDAGVTRAGPVAGTGERAGASGVEVVGVALDRAGAVVAIAGAERVLHDRDGARGGLVVQPASAGGRD